MNDDLEQQLQHMLHARADALPGTVDVPDGLDAAVRRTRTRKMATALSGATLVAAAIAVAIIVPNLSSSPRPGGRIATKPPHTAPSTTSTTKAPAPAPAPSVPTAPAVAEAWSLIPSGPVGGELGVWTGSELIVADSGCCDTRAKNQLAAFNPATGAWRDVAPFPFGGRDSASAVWDGHEMLVAGGLGDPNGLATSTAAAYDPVANTWRSLAPAPEVFAAAPSVWTGKQMLVLGRISSVSNEPFGLAFDPATNEWSRLPASPALARHDALVVWAGNELIVWGGVATPADDTAVEGDGFAYNPTTKTWQSIGTAPVAPRADTAGVWTGKELVFWGGSNDAGGGSTAKAYGQGAAYNPTTNKWRALKTSPLEARSGHTAVWTGSEMVVIGGFSDRANQSPTGSFLASAGAYNPATNTWRLLSSSPELAPDATGRLASPATMRSFSHSAWTGTQVLVMNGAVPGLQAYATDGVLYTPPR